MGKSYLTVEQISELLNIHPKTTQRYIREGKLRAIKVGKSWRVSGHDLSVFLENADAHKQTPNSERAITASSVIDIAGNDAEDAMRIMNLLTSAANAKPPVVSKTLMRTMYIQHEKIVRVMLWGDLRFLSAMIDMIITITEQVPAKSISSEEIL